jgi:hypothetical protein
VLTAQSEEEGVIGVISTSVGPEVVVGPSVADDDLTVRGSLIEEHHGGVPADLRPAEGGQTAREQWLEIGALVDLELD